MKTFRYWTVILLLVSTALLLHLRGDTDRVPSSQPLSRMPETIGAWNGRDLPIGEDIIAVLGKGDFLSRIYEGKPGTVPISLFIGYFPTQRTGQTIHSPQNCLPGAGWTFESSHYATIQGSDAKSYHVGEYVIGNGDSRQFVIYWYQAHGRSIANEYSAKIHMVLDAIRMDRTDGALVRVVTPIAPYETLAQARNRAIRFTGQMVPFLPRFIPN
ncbi:MAG: exosortase C-terminal domain/associated protein EpsI [Acidobacteriaceae bacterium]